MYSTFLQIAMAFTTNLATNHFHNMGIPSENSICPLWPEDDIAHSLSSILHFFHHCNVLVMWEIKSEILVTTFPLVAIHLLLVT